MILKRVSLALICAASAAALTSCGMFGSKPAPAPSYAGGQEFDPYTNSWKPAQRVAVGTSQPNAMLAQRAEEQKRENTFIKKTGRAVNNTATAAGNAVKKPLKWIPFVGKKGEEKDPNYYPAPAPGQ